MSLLSHLSAFSAGLVGGALVYFVLVKRRRGKRKSTQTEVLFFPDEATSDFAGSSMEERGMAYKQILPHSPGVARMVHHLSSAERTIDICMFTLTNETLSEAVLWKLHDNVRVRLITDAQSEATSGSQVGRFRSAGAFVRSVKSQYLMHHKFAVVDGRVLINGSFNWTMQAVMGNHENVLITDAEDLVAPYQEKFDEMWEEFEWKEFNLMQGDR